MKTIAFTWLLFCLAVPDAPSQEVSGLEFPFPEVHRTLVFDADNPIFELSTSVSGQGDADFTIGPADFRRSSVTAEGNVTRVVYEEPPAVWGGNVRVEITLTRLEKEIEARLRLESGSYFPIQRVRFPIIRERTSHYDTMLLSHPMGDSIYYPNRTISGRLGGRLSYRYPATLSMQYMVLHNAGRSIYLSAYSLGDETFEHTVRTKSGHAQMSIDWFPFIEKGSWESPACGFTLFPGGWHSSADLYRTRMEPHFPPPPIPKWMRENFHGWLQISMKGASENPPWKYRDLPGFYRDEVAPLGLNVLHIFSWGAGGFDNDYPLRTPSPNLGTEEDLKEAMKAIGDMGGHVVLYTNGRLIDPDASFYTEMAGDKALALDENGDPYMEYYTRRFYVACPSARAYQDAMVDNFDRMLRRYGNHAAQIDQISCTPGNFCYDLSHGHSTPANNFLPGLDAYLSRIRDLYTTLNPDFFIWAEGTQERLGKYYHVHQSHGEEGTWTVGDSLPEQYRYTYPQHPMTGIADGIQPMAHTYGQGKPFDFHFQRLREPQAPAFRKQLMEFISVRKREAPYFLRGRFLDTVGLTVNGEDVRFWGIEREDRKGLLVNLWARGREPGQPASAWVRIPDRKGKHRLVYPASLQARKQGDWLNLTWEGPAATVVWE